MARADRIEGSVPVGGAGNSGRGSSAGPRFSDYGLRRSTNSLTPEEIKAEHKWRMKNDLDYKNEMARQKVQGSQAGHTTTSVDRKTGKAK